MPDPLRPPNGWTAYHSIALLLVCASCIDGEVARDEVHTIRQRLSRYPDLDGDAARVLSAAVHHYEALRQADHVLAALDEHCRRLARTLDDDTRRGVLDDVIAVVGADDTVVASEQGYLEAIYRHFRVEKPH